MLGRAEDDPADPTALVVATSGSTGLPRYALLPASALLASASATHDRLGGPGHWLLALPAHHVAGLQVLVRSLVGRTAPGVLDPTGFTADRFAAAAREHLASGLRAYVSLVPTQLRRIVAAGGEALDLLAAFGAVLVGGAAAPPHLVAAARAAGVRVVLTYGMTETCGGCVYDGRPLDGVAVEVEPDGRIRIAGPVLARGYLDRPDLGFVTGPDRRRWFRTGDLGRLEDGVLSVLGRLDDVIVSGGVKIDPAAVEGAVLTLPSVAEAVVCGVPDDEWGRRVVAAVVPSDPATPPTPAEVRAVVADKLGRASAPRQLLVLSRLPVRGPGKPDRAAVAALAERQDLTAVPAGGTVEGSAVGVADDEEDVRGVRDTGDES